MRLKMKKSDRFDGFTVNVFLDEDDEYLSHFVELPNVSAFGESSEDALTELATAWEGVDLSVSVHQVKSMIIYVIGRVNKPGHFELNTDVNVLQALAMAGGLNPFAKRGDIKIFRETGGETKVFIFDYDAASSGDDIRKNIKLKRGDLIVVP
jgi:polysaccharide biosynthesis/export protein